jgi:hypothetical protein
MTTKATKKTTTKPKAKVVTGPSQTIPNLPKNPFAFEVLDLVSRQRSKAKKIAALKKYEHVSLKAVLIWNFDETIVTILPEGDVPYSGFEDQSKYEGGVSAKITNEVRKMHETGSFSLGSSDRNGHTTIRREFKNFYHFLKGGNPGLSAIRRETMFINVLEGLHPLEAEIICLCKDGKLSDKYNITKEIVSEAYPDIIWGNRG